jgi:hypothetical protein
MKKFVACLLAVSMSFATIGCGGEGDAGKKKDDVKADTKVDDKADDTKTDDTKTGE